MANPTLAIRPITAPDPIVAPEQSPDGGQALKDGRSRGLTGGIFRVLGLLVALALFAYFLRFAWVALSAHDLSPLLSPMTQAAIVLSSLLSMLVLGISSWAWKHLLDGMSEPHGFRPLYTAVALTQIAKYLPGNVAQHLSRVAYALSMGMNPSVLAASVVLETLLLLGGGAIVGVLIWVVADPFVASLAPAISASEALLLLAALVGIGGAFAWAFPFFQATLARNAAARRLLKLDAKLPGKGVIFRVTLAYIACYFLLGAGLWLLVKSLGGATELGFLQLTAAFAVAWLAGYVAPGVPAGLGAREGLLLLMLDGQAGDDLVLAAIVGARIASILADLCSFALGLALSRLIRANARE